MNGWVNELIDGWIHEWPQKKWMNERMKKTGNECTKIGNEWMNVWMKTGNECMRKQVGNELTIMAITWKYWQNEWMSRQESDEWMDGWMNEQVGKQQINKWMDERMTWILTWQCLGQNLT